ncbi:VOC family protein [Dokdonia sp. Hel_I_53]|uniref:VOC family protein n=1 Tax=Dokdonia sp. Hel_I_53 TaxID=1566287 RepID=UPI001198E6A9|nr:VOC family protein [Dokdonia sp. Hel_I_53]TVZ53373.1 PhnB protein [Dokdonia sp. Hel_I_53]
MKIQAYLAFSGACEQAFNFYKNLFGGSLQNKETWEGKGQDIPEHYRDKIQHIELKGSGVHFMGYDASPDTPINNGSNICMSIDLDSKEKADEIFNALSKSGTVHSPMQGSSWGEYYGRCSDQFDVMWMINAK